MATQSTKARSARAAPRKDEVYARLKEAIVDNRLEPGTPLSEEKLAAEHGLSRTPIREVLQRLSRDGLVEIIRNRGAFVSRLDPRDMHELFEMREALEGFAARLAAQRMEDREIARLDERFRLLKKKRRGVDARDLSKAGEDLHIAIQAASGNRRLTEALDRIQLHSRRAFRFSMTIPQRMEISFGSTCPSCARSGGATPMRPRPPCGRTCAARGRASWPRWPTPIRADPPSHRDGMFEITPITGRRE